MIALQDTLNRLGRASSKAHLEDVVRFRTSGELFGRGVLSGGLAEEVRLLMLEVNMLTERVAADELRAAIGRTTFAWSELSDGRSEEHAGELFRDAATTAFTTNRELGAVLRSLY